MKRSLGGEGKGKKDRGMKIEKRPAGWWGASLHEKELRTRSLTGDLHNYRMR